MTQINRILEQPGNELISSVKNFSSLEELENKIISAVRDFSSEEILLSVHKHLKGIQHNHSNLDSSGSNSDFLFEPFMAASIISFAFRHSNPYRHKDKNMTAQDLKSLYELISIYLLADPVTIDATVASEFQKSNPIFMVLRIAAQQLPYKVDLFASLGQTLFLFDKLPSTLLKRSTNTIPDFDFPKEFKTLTGLTVKDYLTCSFLMYSGFNSSNSLGLTREYFDKARDGGMKIPEDSKICKFLDSISATPNTFRKSYDETKPENRLYGMYSFNPLMKYPILRPWQGRSTIVKQTDKILAPLPELILYRSSTGIYYDMFNHFKEKFSTYFGYLFENYIGVLLENSVNKQYLISEEKIRKSYSENSGKVPDWVILDGTTIILIECKATRFSLPALQTGTTEAINYSLKQILKGLKQLHEFSQAITNKNQGLEQFHSYREIEPIIITYEEMHLINTVLFRRHIDDLLQEEGIHDLPWRILSAKDLEELQPHIHSGISFRDILLEIKNNLITDVMKKTREKTGLTYKDSFLYQQDLELFERYNINSHNDTQ